MDNDSRTCTALMGDMSFCGRPPVPLAPFPICRRHLRQAHQFVQGLLQESLERGAEDAAQRQEEWRRSRTIGLDANAVVYYILERDDMVKIGHTGDLRQRLVALRLGFDAVLATEPGGPSLERERHQQFKHLRQGKWEKFRPAADLQAHIAEVLEQHGPPTLPTPRRAPVEILDVKT